METDNIKKLWNNALYGKIRVLEPHAMVIFKKGQTAISIPADKLDKDKLCFYLYKKDVIQAIFKRELIDYIYLTNI